MPQALNLQALHQPDPTCHCFRLHCWKMRAPPPPPQYGGPALLSVGYKERGVQTAIYII